ncbi:protein kinase C delta type-like [Dendropsophus ebraccatus]|uniref:protein kinase C delta type-like n=1 Tax=Dendropsophus ebraccatus TaxID=150705 RepID=UPI003831527E
MASTEERENGERRQKRRREEESEEREKKRRGEDGGFERKRQEKRKRQEESEEREKKRRGDDGGVLEDEESGPDGTQDPAPPRCTISDFTIHQELGRGAFGRVFLASTPSRSDYVAMKVIRKKKKNEAILQRERRILLMARDCPFILHLYAALQSRGQAYFITEHLAGGSLEDLIRMCGYLDPNNVRFYTAEIACGLQFLHGKKIVHRDLKPGNIMLDGDGHIRIIDLGLAQDGVSASKKITGVTGTFAYIAPEVFLHQYDTAADWWSLGIVVSRMAAGHSPFYFGPVYKMAYKSITRDQPNIPSWLNNDLHLLITELLCKDSEKRLGVSKNIRDHPFFITIDWEELEQRRAQPPFIPFKAVLRNEHLQWPEETTSHHPVAGFSFTASSWAR